MKLGSRRPKFDGKFHVLELTDIESGVFKSLVDACSARMTCSVLRAAGGWVRDKLLKLGSGDIDIAVDNMTGDELATIVHDYVASHGQGALSRVTVVRENPEQSKHLRTATFTINGLSLDFTNLRSETYTQDSRIPTSIGFGTPLEDALRRDFTVNSLFYNLMTRKVEDFTGRGLEDLSKGVLRTPLPSRETFTDDPLRMMRAVRFASRFDFEMTPDIWSSLNEPGLISAMLKKVSRERIGTELQKMLSHSGGCIQAMDYLCASGMAGSLLGKPYRSELGMLSALEEEVKKIDCAESRLVFCLSLLLHLTDCRDSFADAKALHAAVMIPQRLCARSLVALKCGSEVKANLDSKWDPVFLGRLVRGTGLGGDFGVCVSLLTSEALLHGDNSTMSKIATFADNSNRANSEYELLQCHEWKPVLDGNELRSTLNIAKPGPIMTKLMSTQLDLMYRGCRDKDEIVEACRKVVEASGVA